MSIVDSTTDGRAYGRPQSTFDADLVYSGPGTLGGELLRRYWQPFAMSTDATSRPKQVKILGEELVLFRTGNGEVGLLYPRCMHRGTNLIFGKIEECGIRCCYHGWLFTPTGKCLETPAEPSNDPRDKVRQPWYPVVEKFGLLFTYMGPPERQPPFPTFSIEDNIKDDEQIISYMVDGGPNGMHPKIKARADFNWWQTYDNFMDPLHVVVLHCTINGAQFSPSLAVLPRLKFDYTKDGVICIQHRDMPDGNIHQRLSQVILPNINCTPGVNDEDLGPAGLGWTVPVDDTNFVQFRVMRTKKGIDGYKQYEQFGMLKDDWGPKHKRPLREWSLEDHQDWQTDYVAQKGQGDITLHSEEHFTSGDQGIAMMRRTFRKLAQQVARGEDPIGAGAQNQYRVEILAGNGILDKATGECIAGVATRKWPAAGGAQPTT